MTEQEFFDRLEKTKDWGWGLTPDGYIRCRIQCSDSLACPITAVAAESPAVLKDARLVNSCANRLAMNDKNFVSAIIQAADNVQIASYCPTWQEILNPIRVRLLQILGLSERTGAK
jgi:hypothetical protein